MKNSQKGFVAPLLIAIIALLVIGGGIYVYENNKPEVPAVVDNGTQQNNQNQQQTNTQNPPIDTQQTENPTTQQSITISSPSTGGVWLTGNTYQVKWKTSGMSLDAQGYVLLKNTAQGGDYYVVNKSVALNGGAASNYGGSRNYTVPSESPSFLTGKYIIRIGVGRYEDYNGVRSTYFDSAPFTITPAQNSPVSVSSSAGSPITLLSPNGGEKFIKSKIYKITWKTSSFFNSAYPQVSITLITAKGQQAVTPNQQIITNNTGSFDWAVPAAQLSGSIQDYSGGPYALRVLDNQTAFQFLIEGYPHTTGRAEGPFDYTDGSFQIESQ